MKVPYSKIRVKDCNSNRLRFSYGDNDCQLDFFTGEELFKMTHIYLFEGFKTRREYEASSLFERRKSEFMEFIESAHEFGVFS